MLALTWPELLVLIAPTRDCNTHPPAPRTWGSDVLIAPTRDCNSTWMPVSSASSRSPHRPYEGLQRVVQREQQPLVVVLIAPTRDCNVPSARCRLQVPRVLIAPTRDCNMRQMVRDAMGERCPHRPYEGLQHDPRGVQHDDLLVLIAPTRDCNPTISCIRCVTLMSSSPLRGIATSCAYLAGYRPTRVLIAPTRDCNSVETTQRANSRRRPHRPYEGL
ncbi:hypothetical protein FrEUN1fDRAFT_7993 [Parafrankia sp. EUN1f]|nr:hypothetical protein FrEUN1fDRAFT_7993 [Parafrankia sp. EUN1f]